MKYHRERPIMPTLLPELAEALAESNRRAAAWIDAEVAAAERIRARAGRVSELEAELATVRRRTARTARAETLALTARADELTDLWETTIASLRRLAADEQLLVLTGVVRVVDAGTIYVAAARELWALVERLGGPHGGDVELSQFADRLAKIRREAVGAIESRVRPWQPKDPERFAEAMRADRERKTLTPDEVRAYFLAARE
jgi:hypothetical protein